MTARVLIVEDEWLIAQDLARIVRSYGLSVYGTASSGRAACLLIDAAWAEAADPILAIIDIKLRGDIDGFFVAKYLREKAGEAPAIIFMSGLLTESEQHAADASTVYLTKPVEEQELADAMRAVLRHVSKVERRPARRSGQGA